MATIMVYGMIFYNVALNTGGVTNATFGMALHLSLIHILIKKPRYLTDGTLDTMFTRSSNTTHVLYHSAARYNRSAHKTEKKKALSLIHI